MNVLSLFDGISCCRVALDRAGIEVENYYASEIDKFAIKIATKNYPDNVNLGSVENWRGWNIDWSSIDLITGGFCCQSFSLAGKQKGFDDARGQLFFTMIDIFNHLKAIRPDVKFLFENVRMKKEFMEKINDLIGVKPILINSALVSAQSRWRNYWCNWHVEQPEDRGIMLKDVIENGATDRWKSFCLTTSNGGSNPDRYYNRGRGTIVFENEDVIHEIKGTAQRGRRQKDGVLKQHIEQRNDGKANALTLTAKVRLVSIIQRPRGFNKGGEFFEKSPAMTSNSWQCNNTLQFKNRYRQLSVIECERLQTLPQKYTEGVSNSQRYKALGNGWTVEVISHIFRGIKQ